MNSYCEDYPNGCYFCEYINCVIAVCDCERNCDGCKYANDIECLREEE